MPERIVIALGGNALQSGNSAPTAEAQLEVVKKTNIDLTLSGHTHAMQSMLEIGGKKYSLAAKKYPNWAGLTSENGKYLYVNIGIGEVGVPMRLGATPELTLITLHCN